MPALPLLLEEISNKRRRDPLAPLTVIVPSHVAAIQLRRRLAERAPFAGVRFEMLPRLAELIAGGDLARRGRRPLARPIADYVAAQVARQARGQLSEVSELAGFSRVLRQTFRRLRRGGFRRAEEVPVGFGSGLLGEVTRLYGRFRAETQAFYDDEDLLEAGAASLEARRTGIGADLGEIYLLPGIAESAGAEALLSAVRRAVGASRYHLVADAVPTAENRFILAPDHSSEAREVVRELIGSLEAGAGLHEIAVFHGADVAYRPLLSQALTAAGVPFSAMPGTPLSETRSGRGALMLVELPGQDYARNRVIDFFSLAPLKSFLPGASGRVQLLPAAWRRLAREASVTKGEERWASALAGVRGEFEARRNDPDASDAMRSNFDSRVQQVLDLEGVVRHLIERLEPLKDSQPASVFIQRFGAIVDEYFDPAAEALAHVKEQIEQLGTIDAVGGSFTLESFGAALRANLDAAYYREAALGSGVFLGDFRSAGGLSFRRTILCGAYEGVFPPAPPAEPLVADDAWQQLRRHHPQIEDAALRSERAASHVSRAVAAARERLTWSAPLQAANSGREFYPSRSLLAAAQSIDPSLESASALRRASHRPWLRRPPSPLAALLSGTPSDMHELRLRSAVVARRDRRSPVASSPLSRPLALLHARRDASFNAYKGNLSGLPPQELIPSGTVSPTSLEAYAGCGFKYFLHSILGLRDPDEPEERETMDPAEKGSIVHEALREFFEKQKALGRPAVNEAWTEADREELLSILDRWLDEARERGRTGLDVYAAFERRRLRADMAAFLEQDSEFRARTGAVPHGFEVRIPEETVAGLVMRGLADRIDRTPDGRHAWVIDYKTGSSQTYEVMKPEDPLAGGTRLQLPVYLAAARDAETATALYWFISSRGGFKQRDFANTPENRQRYAETLEAILDGLKRGAFPANPGPFSDFYNTWNNCQYCDFARLCSRRRDDDFEAMAADPAIKSWTRIATIARDGPQQ